MWGSKVRGGLCCAGRAEGVAERVAVTQHTLHVMLLQDCLAALSQTANGRLSEHCCLSKTFWLSSLIASSLFSSADSVLAPQDHPAVLTAFYLKEDAGPISITDELLHSSGRIRVRAIMKYLLFKKGPLASTGCDHGAFVSTNGASLTQLYSSLNP